MSLPKIAIVGGGPAGLCLANILQKNNIPFTLFEHDSSPNERNQGGTLDLHGDGGQVAIREAGVWDKFIKHARPESDVLKVVRQDGKVLWDGNAMDPVPMPEEEKYTWNPEIDRTKLKEILLDSLNNQALQYGKVLIEATAGSQPNTWDLHFRDGSVEKGFDLIVGADGAWSRVRKLLTDIGPH